MTKIRITVACPESLQGAAVQFARVMAGADAGDTYATLTHLDAGGNRYAAASFEAPPEWIAAAQSPLARPDWDVEPHTINMAGADRAQAALVFWVADGETPPPQASTTALTAIGGMDGPAALAAMGLVQAVNEE